MTAAKPAICFIHGAWHVPAHYRLFLDALQARGHTVVAPCLATAGYGDSVVGQGLADDIRRVRELLLPLLDAGRSVILIAHSYGGLVAGAAAEAESVEERKARGLEGGLIGAIFVTAGAATVQGISVYEAAGNKWLGGDLYTPSETKLILSPDAPNILYNDIEPKLRDQLNRFLVEHSPKPFLDPVPFIAADLKMPKRYVICLQDLALAVAAQRAIAQHMGAVETTELDCGHTPFAREDMVAELLKVVEKAAGDAAA